jgi:hypothetical protein
VGEDEELLVLPHPTAANMATAAKEPARHATGLAPLKPECLSVTLSADVEGEGDNLAATGQRRENGIEALTADLVLADKNPPRIVVRQRSGIELSKLGNGVADPQTKLSPPGLTSDSDVVKVEARGSAARVAAAGRDAVTAEDHREPELVPSDRAEIGETSRSNRAQATRVGRAEHTDRTRVGRRGAVAGDQIAGEGDPRAACPDHRRDDIPAGRGQSGHSGETRRGEHEGCDPSD